MHHKIYDLLPILRPPHALAALLPLQPTNLAKCPGLLSFSRCLSEKRHRHLSVTAPPAQTAFLHFPACLQRPTQTASCHGYRNPGRIYGLSKQYSFLTCTWFFFLPYNFVLLGPSSYRLTLVPPSPASHELKHLFLAACHFSAHALSSSHMTTLLHRLMSPPIPRSQSAIYLRDINQS